MNEPGQSLLFGADGTVAYQPRQRVEPPVARGRATSVDAGQRIREPAKTFQVQVLDTIREGPKTDEEIGKATGMRGNSVRPRRLELLRAKLIEDSGEVRPTESGRDAIVWRIRAPEEGVGCGSD